MLNATQLADYHKQGFTLSDPLFTDNEIDAFVHEIEGIRASDRPTTMRGNNPFQGALEADYPFAFATITDPRVIAIAMQILGPDVDLFSGSQIAYKPARTGTPFTWHQDGGFNYIEPCTYVTMWLALDDVTVENGTIWVIPESHTWGRLRHVRPPDTPGTMIAYDEHAPYQGVPVIARRGQIAVFSSLTLHKSGNNTTDNPRRAWVMQYCLPGTHNPNTGVLMSTLAVARAGRKINHPFATTAEMAQHKFPRLEVIEGATPPDLSHLVSG